MTRGDYQQRPDTGLFSSTSEVPKQRWRVLGKRAASPNRSFLPSGGGSRNGLLGRAFLRVSCLGLGALATLPRPPLTCQ